MGYSANRANVLLLLSALEDILSDLGHPMVPGATIEAAQAVYHQYDKARRVSTSGNSEGESIPSENMARGVAHRD